MSAEKDDVPESPAPPDAVAVIGLGYVGLPVALALAKHFDVVGFDIDESRVAELREGRDRTNEADLDELKSTTLEVSSDPAALGVATAFIVTVPTPIDDDRRPDLRPLLAACTTVGQALRRGSLVIFESTVYPGVTEQVCVPALEACSGLRWRDDFHVGYSPERINPGDREHTLERTVKVVAGDDLVSLERVARIYERVVDAGVFRAKSIAVAEAAKVIENTQRDLNIALMNELALIFERLGLRTRDVLDAAGTKWNFLRFTPGLVGGHCIGVDPYYLTARAEAAGYHPQVILAGRRINDGMGAFIAQRLVKMLIRGDRPVRGARVGVFGLTFKEDVPDLRNSRVPDIVEELRDFGCQTLVHDPGASAEAARKEYGIELSPMSEMTGLDGLVLAVSHACYRALDAETIAAHLVDGGALVDVKSVLDPEHVPERVSYWSL